MVINIIYICLLYIYHYIPNNDAIITIFSCGSVAIFYILFFNNFAKKKFDENEGITAVYFFDYSFFLLFSVPLGIIFASIIMVPQCLYLILLVLLIIEFF